MQNKKKFLALVTGIFMLILSFSSSALAITGITSDITQILGETPSVYVNQGESFRITLTAQNPLGVVSWYLSGTYDGINLSPSTGNFTVISGTLNASSYSLAVVAYDSGGSDTDDIAAGYSFVILDSSQYNNDDAGNINPAPDNGGGDNVVPAPDNGGGNVVPDPDNGGGSVVPVPIEDDPVPDENPELNIGVITIIPELSDDVLENIANNISVDKSEIILLTSRDFTTTTPPEPTDELRRQVQSDNGQFAAKLNTIKVERDGWYSFVVTVSDDLVGTKVSDLKLYGLEGADAASGTVKGKIWLHLINGATGAAEVSNFLGWKLDTLPKQFIMTMFLSASQSMTVYIVKILLMLLAGGCNSGFGIIGGSVFVAAFGVWAVKFFRKR